MTPKEVAMLIAQLKEENKTNSKEEREFNLRWLELIYAAMGNAISGKKKINKK